MFERQVGSYLFVSCRTRLRRGITGCSDIKVTETNLKMITNGTAVVLRNPPCEPAQAIEFSLTMVVALPLFHPFGPLQLSNTMLGAVLAVAPCGSTTAAGVDYFFFPSLAGMLCWWCGCVCCHHVVWSCCSNHHPTAAGQWHAIARR